MLRQIKDTRRLRSLICFAHNFELKFQNILKEALYQSGAIYAAMSGSGSSVFGLFTNEDAAMNFNSIHLIYKGRFKNQA